jgi:short-subunit dehydrogenase
MGNFTGQVALVTGGSSGVGRAIALSLAAQGAELCLVGRNRERLEEVATYARTTSPRVLSHRADLILDEEIQQLVARVQRDFAQIDILVHSAGIITFGEVETAAVADFDQQYRINIRAPYVLTQALLPGLKARQGQIVFINSSVALNARASVGQYAATKHALKAMADSLRDEVNAAGVRVLSVFLGRTASPMQVAVHAMEGKAYHPERLIQPPDVAAVVLNALSLPPSAEVTDIHIRPLMKPLPS